jgi:hypothetical protein
MKRDTCRLNSQTFIAKLLPASLLGVCAGYFQATEVGGSGIIISQMWKHTRSVMVAVYGTRFAIPPRNSNNTVFVCVMFSQTFLQVVPALRSFYGQGNVEIEKMRKEYEINRRKEIKV